MVIRDEAHSRGLVLVVEENEGMRRAIDNLLDAAGFSGVAYASAEALIAGGQVEDGVCVISDIKLPGMSGFDLLTELRGRGTPVILIAAHGGARTRSKAKRRGAAAYLEKPFAGSALLAAVESVAGAGRRK
jgi:FixJ family two-component response regulator